MTRRSSWSRRITAAVVLAIVGASAVAFAMHPGTGAFQGAPGNETTAMPTNETRPADNATAGGGEATPYVPVDLSGDVCPVYSTLVEAGGLDAEVQVLTADGETLTLTTEEITAAAAGLMAQDEQRLGQAANATDRVVDSQRTFALLAASCDETARTPSGVSTPSPTAPAAPDQAERTQRSGDLLDMSGEEFFSGTGF